MKVLTSVISLLLSTALLLIGHGMQLTLLPLRAAANGMPESLIGISASSYFLGFVAACLWFPRVIGRVGHIRSFAALAAMMISAVLALELIDHWIPWLFLRFITGAAICGLYSVIESWLNSQTTAETRGQVLSIYTFIILTAMTAGQFLINVGPVDSSSPFTLAAIFVAAAIIPISLTSRMGPPPVATKKLRFRLLYDLSKSGFFGAVLSGLVVGSFWSLGAVYARNFGETQTDVTWFMSAAIAGGAILQYPIGWLSDRLDRRYILILLCIGGTMTSAAVALSTGSELHLLIVFIFGAMVMPIYAISLATAADVCSVDDFVEVGTSVLLLNALGAAAAPLLLGQLMTTFGPNALFWAFSGVCGVFCVVFLILSRQPRLVTVEEQTPFAPAASEVAPQSFELDPRASEEGQ